MNIAFFVPIIDQTGGAEIGTWRLAERMVQRGHYVTILSTQALSYWRKHPSIIDYAKGVRLIRLPVWQRSRSVFARMLAVQALWALPVFLRETQIIHLRGLTPESLILARIARRSGTTTLCVPMASGLYGDVTTFPAHIPKDSTMLDWVSGLTETLRAEAIAWGVPANRTGIIPNGVDLDLFRPPESPNDDPRVIFVGQFRPEKRVNLLFHAWTQVQSEHPHAQLTLVGGGQFTKTYIQMADEMRISPMFVPNTDAAGVLANLRANSIFITPGISEGMSNALLEAMAVGLAPVIANTPANRAVVTPEIDGLSYPADSPETLALQIKRLISDTDLRHRISAAAHKTVFQRFNLDTVTDQYLALYRQLLGE